MSKQTAEQIEQLAKKLYDKWSVVYDGRRYMPLDLFTLAIQSPELVAMHQYASPSPGWIKASEPGDGWNTIDKLPDYDNLVLWWPEDGIAFTDMLDKDGLPDWLLKGKENGAKITHWRQIKGPDDYKYDLDKPSKPVAHGQYKEYGDYLTRQEMEELDARFKTQTAESPAKPEGEGLQWIKASDLKEKDPNREYIGKWRRGHVNNGRFSADGSSFFFDKYGQVDYMYYDHLFILVTGAAAHSPADSNTKKIKP